MNKFNEELDELKKANQEIKLDDEFKSSLKIKLDEEISKQEEKLNKKPKLNLLPRKLIPVTVCLFVLFVTIQTFADEIESLVKCVFSNVDETVEEAIANGNYQKIDMEYVEHDGISIKVDYIIQENNNTYIAFNLLYEELYDYINFMGIKLIDEEENEYKIENLYINLIDENISKNNKYMVYKINEFNSVLNRVVIENMVINNNDIINNMWELKLYEEAD